MPETFSCETEISLNKGRQPIHTFHPIRSHNRGTLKRCIEWFPRTTLKDRLTIAYGLMTAGVAIFVLLVWSMAANVQTLSRILCAVVGAILIIAGLFLLVIEKWLTQGQSALVDGFHAG
jgi:hypothetical protein